MREQKQAQAQDQIISEVPEQTTSWPYPGMAAIAPQGALRNLAELRADYPNLEILPPLACQTRKLNASQEVNFDLPDFTEFIIISCSSPVMFSAQGRAFLPVAGDGNVSGMMIIPAGSEKRIYTGGIKQVSVMDYSAAAPVVSIAYYVTDKLVMM